MLGGGGVALTFPRGERQCHGHKIVNSAHNVMGRDPGRGYRGLQNRLHAEDGGFEIARDSLFVLEFICIEKCF